MLHFALICVYSAEIRLRVGRVVGFPVHSSFVLMKNKLHLSTNFHCLRIPQNALQVLSKYSQHPV